MLKADVIKHFGTQANIVKALRNAGYPISRPAVSKWNDVIPEKQALRIEKITGGALTEKTPGSKAAA